MEDDPYKTSKQNSVDLEELLSMDKLSVIYLSSCSEHTTSVRGHLRISRQNILELTNKRLFNIINLVVSCNDQIGYQSTAISFS